MKQNVTAILSHVEECLILGQSANALKQLEDLLAADIPRDGLVKAAQLYRRVGWYTQSLRILRPVVYGKGKASSHEIVEYAICLQRCGAIQEACRWLESVSSRELPEALLYKTSFKFADWDFRGGVKNLLQLINICDPESYLHRLAQLNLASAFVLEERYEEAETVLTELRNQTAERGEYLMFCNTLEVSVQVAILTEQYELAQELLEQAQGVVKSASSVEALWLVKAQAMTKAFLTQDVSHLVKARDLAIDKHHWEMVRDLDFAKCKIQFDQDLYNKLYFGTPYPSYRRRIQQELGTVKNQHAFLYSDGSYKSVKPNRFISLKDLKGDLLPGEPAQILLSLLLSDAYRHWQLAQVHEQLFPQKPFVPEQASKEVLKVVSKLNKALDQEVPGAKAIHENGIFELDVSAIKMPLDIYTHVLGQKAPRAADRKTNKKRKAG